METKKIKILNKFNAQSFPLDESAIEVSAKDLNQIGITKCFDVENNCIIDYDNTEDVRKKEIKNRIEELKELLIESDYRAIKYAEGCYTEQEYQPIKELRQAYRNEINELEAQLGGEE